MEISVFRGGTPGGRKRGWRLNKRLRSLIQKLGEAIHETVSESEDIASVVQDIRKQGFDVLLMLEATIGLNEMEQQPKSLTAGSAGVGEAVSGSGFTAQDKDFLQSLRIALEDESESSTGASISE